MWGGDLYSYLYKTSRTLFLLILKEKNVNDTFKQNIKLMLSSISKIQSNEISQNTASEEIGTVLANEYIPSNLR